MATNSPEGTTVNLQINSPAPIIAMIEGQRVFMNRTSDPITTVAAQCPMQNCSCEICSGNGSSFDQVRIPVEAVQHGQSTRPSVLVIQQRFGYLTLSIETPEA